MIAVAVAAVLFTAALTAPAAVLVWAQRPRLTALTARPRAALRIRLNGGRSDG